jgi:hypothetical protein
LVRSSSIYGDFRRGQTPSPAKRVPIVDSPAQAVMTKIIQHLRFEKDMPGPINLDVVLISVSKSSGCVIFSFVSGHERRQKNAAG